MRRLRWGRPRRHRVGGPSGSTPAEVWNESVISEVSPPAGTPLRLHLHNHGQNTWNLAEIQAEVH